MSETFIHRFVPGSTGQAVLALHGTGGSEHDLIPLAQALCPGAAVLSPRGQVLERGMPRFFRRLAEGVFDMDDVRRRAHELADFVEAAARQYGFDVSRMIAVGFSNGANIAAAMLLLRPSLIRRAVLLRPMVPIEPVPLPDLRAARVRLHAGTEDPIVVPEESRRLAGLLERCGAEVWLEWYRGGHQLQSREVDDARRWLGSDDGAAPS